MLVYALEEGIEPEYAKSLIKRRGLVPEQPPLAVEGWPWTYRVQTFGGFRLLRHDEPLNAGQGKAKKRPLELLKLLIAYGGEQVSEARSPTRSGRASMAIRRIVPSRALFTA